MIQDRLKIKKLRAGDLAPDVMLGRQTLLNCAAFKGWGQGCDGGEPLEVSRFATLLWPHGIKLVAAGLWYHTTGRKSLLRC